MITAVLTVNGEAYPVVFPAHHTLLEVLREECGLPGTKHGCELGECGACAVLVDGEPVMSCLQITSDVVGKSIETVEGLQDGNNLSPLQEAFADLGAAQCGYCTPGILMVAEALLAREPQPNGEQIAEALAGNICRCTGYQRIIEAVKWAAAKRRGDDWRPAEALFMGDKVPGGNTL
jgi:aerobic-type carbon monoxide dehydrogenase small subunit (CoxS/CutS family)